MFGNENYVTKPDFGSSSVNSFEKRKMFKMSKSSSGDLIGNGCLKDSNRLKTPVTSNEIKPRTNTILKVTNNALNRSNSVDLLEKHPSSNLFRIGLNKTVENLKLNESPDSYSTPKSKNSKELVKSGAFEPPSSLVEMHKFLKDQKIYSNPSDNFKRRTIILVRPRMMDNIPGEFGFHLQTYGLFNSTTNQTEFICFVNNILANSPAKLAGLNNGDVLLAIDGLKIDEFRSMQDITRHVKNKNELRLVIMCENVCKKIQLQQRAEKIRKMLTEKRSELEKIEAEQNRILIKYKNKEFSSPLPNSSTIFNSTPILPLGSKPSNDYSLILSPSEISKNDSTNSAIIKVDSQLSSSSSSSSTSLNQAKSIAHRYLKQTTRIVRSASSSSMNLLTNLKIKSESSSRNNLNSNYTEPVQDTHRKKVVSIVNPDDRESIVSSSFSASSSTRSSSSLTSNQTVKPTELAYIQVCFLIYRVFRTDYSARNPKCHFEFWKTIILELLLRS